MRYFPSFAPIFALFVSVAAVFGRALLFVSFLLFVSVPLFPLVPPFRPFRFFSSPSRPFLAAPKYAQKVPRRREPFPKAWHLSITIILEYYLRLRLNL